MIGRKEQGHAADSGLVWLPVGIQVGGDPGHLAENRPRWTPLGFDLNHRNRDRQPGRKPAANGLYGFRFEPPRLVGSMLFLHWLRHGNARKSPS